MFFALLKGAVFLVYDRYILLPPVDLKIVFCLVWIS